MVGSTSPASPARSIIHPECRPDLGGSPLSELAPQADEEEIAEAIFLDADREVRLGRVPTLDRYLRFIVDLPARPVALDAAIEAILRHSIGPTRTRSEAADALQRLHPELKGAIADASAFGLLLLSTRALPLYDDEEMIRPPQLPQDFGPVMEDGRPRYQLQAILGRGSFGAVYRAVDRQLTNDERFPASVAIKVLHARRIPAETERQRFVDEAAKARRIRHRNVVSVIDRGSVRHQDFIVYEYVDGPTLDRWRDCNSPIAMREAARIISQVARGVHAAHVRGLIHCDLKPHNILMDSASGEARVTDFGVARLYEENQEKPRTGRQGERLGNLGFIAPEQYRIEDGASAFPADVYGIGGLLYWIVTGDPPNGRTRREVHRRLSDDRGLASSEIMGNVAFSSSPDVAAICAKALSPRPDARYQSAAELADDLESWLEHRPIRARPRSLAGRLALWSRRKPATAAAVVVTIAGVVGGGVLVDRIVHMSMQRENFKQHMGRLTSSLRKAVDTGRTTDKLPEIWMFNWLYDIRVFGGEVEDLSFWELRLDAAEAFHSDVVAGRVKPTLASLLWGKMLAFYYLQMDRQDEAITIIDDLTGIWGEQFSGDSYFDELIDMRTAGVVLQVRARVDRGEPLTEADRRLLESAVSQLELAQARVGTSKTSFPLRNFYLEAIMIGCEGELLNQPARLEAAITELVRSRGDSTPTLRLPHEQIIVDRLENR